MRRMASLVGALGLVACAARTPAKEPEAARALGEFERDARPFMAHIGSLRGLPDGRPARVFFHGDAEFLGVMRHTTASDPGTPTGADRGAFFAAFSTAMPSAARGTSATDVLEEQVIAYYDLKAHAIHVRQGREAREDPKETMLVLAHEITHSLQQQNLPVPDLGRIVDEDQRLASLALIEGDATLTMLAYSADQEMVGLAHAIVLATSKIDEGEVEQYERARGHSKKLLAAPTLLRERVLFPYLSGFRFAGALHRSGGFALVDAAYRRPPISTEQVLHPERYFAGEQPAWVVPPAPFEGSTLLTSGRMGELLTRALLQQCQSAVVARVAAEGWGGDAYSLVRLGSGQLCVQWSTEWDTETDAAEFESALASSSRCFATPAVTGAFAAGDAVLRRGTRVAWTRGVPTALSAAVLASLLEVPATRPPARPPLGATAFRPIPPQPALRPPYLVPGSYVNERAGIVAPVPPGFSARLERDELVLERQAPSFVYLGFGVGEFRVSSRSLRKFFDLAADGVRKELSGRSLDYVRGGRTSTSLGPALFEEYSVNGTSATFRIVVVPICGAQGGLVLPQAWVDEEGKRFADWYLAALHPLAQGAPPICLELSP